MHRRPVKTSDPQSESVSRRPGKGTAEEKPVDTSAHKSARARRRPRPSSDTNGNLDWLFAADGGMSYISALVVIVIILIMIGLVVIFRLMEEKHVDSRAFPKFHIEKDYKAENSDKDTETGFPALPSSGIYTIPFSMSHIGDKTDRYAALRKDIDEKYPHDPQRSLQTVQSLHYDVGAYPNPMEYDVFNCPDIPPEGYPYEWKTLTILKHWNPHDTDTPSKIYQGLCVFDYYKDHIKALNYREHEVPFVIRGDPEVAAAAERWNTPGYMEEMLGNVPHRTEYSESNHFLYWTPGTPKHSKSKKSRRRPSKIPPGWEEPTKLMRMTYADWLSHANVTDVSKLGPDQPHWYFRLIGCGETGPTGDCDTGSSEYLYDEMPFFQPRPDQLYIVEPELQRGIHCRFGMQGVIAENHFDASRNAIVVLGGQRRYILSHPNQCENLALYPKGHPSARHSQVNWSNPDFDEFPQFANATSNEVVLQPGEVLYLPISWFHFIVSLSLNFQCNTRSGKSDHYTQDMTQCGF